MPTDAQTKAEAYHFWGTYFCGCGDPDHAYEALREIMDLFVEPTEDRITVHLLYGGEKHKAFVARHGTGFTYLILYWLDGMGIAEHGGSVNSCWLTPLGEHVREQVMAGELPDNLKGELGDVGEPGPI